MLSVFIIKIIFFILTPTGEVHESEICEIYKKKLVILFQRIIMHKNNIQMLNL